MLACKNKLSEWLFSKKRGQGILEVVIAISVIVVGLVSIMSLVIFNVGVQSYNHDMLIASNLAREGIEIVRNTRDSNWLTPIDLEWDDSLFLEGENISSDENSFVILNMSGREADNFDYIIFPVGMSWDDCTDDNYNYDGISWAMCRLYFVPVLGDEDYKLYNYGYDFYGDLIEGSNSTNFYRWININEICMNESDGEVILDGYEESCEDDHDLEKIGIQVISRVGWKNRGIMRTVEVEERLYNWK